MRSYLDGLARDFRYALRTLRKDRRVALTAIFALALGVSACTVVFSVVYNSIFEALPYRNFQRLVVFGIRNLANAGGWKGRNFFFPAEFRGFREQNHVFEEMIAYEGVRLQFNDGKSIRYWPTGATVSGNTFEYLGVAPYFGRALSEEDAKPDAPSFS
jgi:putative ABC transport system permease protein